MNVTIISCNDFMRSKMDLDKYDVIFLYAWMTQALDLVDSKNTVVCIAGGDYLESIETLRVRCNRFRYFGANNTKIMSMLLKMFEDKNITLLTHGVDLDLFKPIKRQQGDKFIIGWAGRMNRPLKRFEFAKEIVNTANCKFRIASQEKENRYSHSDMPQFYNSIDCYLSVSTVESHPLTIYEAMASGIPVITTNVGDVNEYIIDGINGFIVDIDTPISRYVEIIDKLRSDNRLRELIGKNARITVKEKLSWIDVSKSYKRIIDEVMRDNSER